MADNTNRNAVEHDLRMIRQLMKGKKRLTPKLAGEIYYKLELYHIRFESFKGDEFLEELESNLTERQKNEVKKQLLERKRRNYQKKRFIRLNKYILTAIFALQLVLCLVILNWNIILDIRTNYNAEHLQAKIGQTTAIAEELGSEISVPKVEDIKPVILSKFKALHDENPDFAGWLTIDGTRIDYPVMAREGDNNYYLDKNFFGREDKNGLLILDYRSDVLARGQNIIIYGHNMRTGVMFGTLSRYKDKSFCEEHPTINFDSLYEECEYKVIAAVLSSVAYEDEDVFRYYDAIDISTKESFDEFKQNIIGNALYTTDESLEYGDSCLVLSTCDYYTEDGRFVVVAKKVTE